MEGMLCCWALAMQEFCFSIEYRKGSLNSNADALSHPEATQHISAATQIPVTESTEELQETQQADSNIKKVADALTQSHKQPMGKIMLRHPPLSHCHQLWSCGGWSCLWTYSLGPTQDIFVVPTILAPVRAPLTSTPVGRPWQMVAVDILEVPVSYKNNRY